jgi:rubredoxin
MASITLRVPGYRCERCGHEWQARGPRKENLPRGTDPEDVKPKLCPKCKSAHWETPKRSKP